jgi:hypothetical protein
MKQYIDKLQVKLLTSEQQAHLRELWSPLKGDLYLPLNTHYQIDDIVLVFDDYEFRFINYKEFKLPLFSMGQCIELLGLEKLKFLIDDLSQETDLIDFLWGEVVKLL